MANKIEEENVGHGVRFVTNLETGAYSIQMRSAGPGPG